MNDKITRRNFLKAGAALAIAGTGAGLPSPKEAFAKAGAYATVIDLTRCDGCQGEGIPKCVEACRVKNQARFPEPVKPIRDLWPHKKHDDWSEKREVINTLTPYNWITVGKIQEGGKDLFVPRRCFHCDNPPCANLCPFGSLGKYETAAVVINPEICMGGAKCKAVCPWQIPQRQSGVGLYLKFQPLPMGGGVMYKCDLCQDLIEKGKPPACVAACGSRLGEKTPLHFGPRKVMEGLAQTRRSEIGGAVYGKEENGGTSTLYVSLVPFSTISYRFKEAKEEIHFNPVSNRLSDTNRYAGAFLAAPVLAAFGAIGLAVREKRAEKKGGQ